MPHKRHPAKRKVFSVQDGRRDVCPEFRLLLGRIVVGCDASGLPLWPGNRSSIALFGQPKSREQEKETLEMRIVVGYTVHTWELRSNRIRLLYTLISGPWPQGVACS